MRVNIHVGERDFPAALGETPGAQAFAAWLREGPVTVSYRDYGGFEKVAPLGRRLPTQDHRTTTHPGDVVLYQGDQVVLFTGSNTWSYTRLAQVEDLAGWKDALGRSGGQVTFTLLP